MNIYMMNGDYTSAYLVACAELYHLNYIARDFTKSAKLLHEQNSISDNIQSFHLLISIAFELFPKILVACDICLKHQNDTNLTVDNIRLKIEQEHRKYGHNLKMLFESLPHLMNELKIDSITKVPDNSNAEWYVCEYRFKVSDYNYLLSIKDVEAVRYGSFSKDRDVAIDCTGNDKILSILLVLQDIVKEKMVMTTNQMRAIV